MTVMSCSWKGNRRSGITLAMCHRLKWSVHLRAQGVSKGDDQSEHMGMGSGTLYLSSLQSSAVEQVLDILMDILSWEIAEVVFPCLPRGL